MLSRSIHAVASDSIFFFLKAEYHSTESIYHIFLIQSLIDRYLVVSVP